ncbi:MAG: class I SAM-dependent methyltransferase [Solirubrobacteraceae bacterium]
MSAVTSSIRAAVADYYSRALTTHGCTAQGVDWSSSESQELRFRTLLAGVHWADCPSVLDYGCGYGALAAYLDRLRVSCQYVGYDLAPTMIAAARRAHPHQRFTAEETALQIADYVVASGVFNVKLDTPTAIWDRYVEHTLTALVSLARRSVSFNMLPPASAPELARPDLYYAEPADVVGFCRRRFPGQVALQRDYGLWEFTVTVGVESSR